MSGRPTRVTASDWALLVISLVFCALGLFLLKSNLRVGAGSLLMFGPCLLLAIQRIRSKRRRDRFNATLVSASGGVELRMSASRFALIGVLAGCAGSSVFLYEDAPLYVKICGGIFLVAGIGTLLAAASGLVSKRFLRFDPEGLTLDEWRYSIHLDWDNITNVVEFEYVRNDCVGFDVIAAEQVKVTPEAFRSRWLKGAGNNMALMGRHVIIMPAHYAVDAAPLAMALSRYALDARARVELTPRPALTAPARN